MCRGKGSAIRDRPVICIARSKDICREGLKYDCLGLSIRRVSNSSIGTLGGTCKRGCRTYRLYDHKRRPTKIMCIAGGDGHFRGERDYDTLGQSMQVIGRARISNRVDTYKQYN